MLDDLKIFIAAADTKSLTAAADKLGMTIATVSRRIAALEAKLGSVLLHRSTKGLTLTTVGERYHRECAEFIDALDQRISNLDHTLNSLEGEVKILAPTNLGVGALDDFWAYFAQQFPDISLRIELNNDYQSLQDTQADFALRVGQDSNLSLVQKKIGEVYSVVVASPSFTKLPIELSDIQHTPSVAGHIFNDWQLIHQSGAQETIQKHHHFQSNDMRVALNLVLRGKGISLLPKGMVYRDLEQGNLLRVLPEWQGPSREIYMVWPYRRSLSVRAKLLRDELTKFLHSQAWFIPS